MSGLLSATAPKWRWRRVHQSRTRAHAPRPGGDDGAASSGAAEASVIAGLEPTEGEDESAVAGSEPTEGEEGAASAGAPAVGSGASSRCGPAA